MAVAKKQTSTVGLLIPTLLQNNLDGWRNPGWAGVTQTTADLLSYWFEEDRDSPQFHECQQTEIETIIYCHEILQIQNLYQLYQEPSPGKARVAKRQRRTSIAIRLY